MEKLERYNSYLGYLDSKDSKAAGRIKKYLEKRVKVDDDQIMQRRDFVLTRVLLGYYPKMYEYDKKEYYLWNDNGAYLVKKTDYDFANYIIVMNFNSDDAVNKYLEKEKMEREKAEKEEADRYLKKVEEDIQNGKKIEICRNAAEQLIENYNNMERISIANNIFADTYGIAENKIDENTNIHQLKQLLVYIENIDNRYCKDCLIMILHTHNKASRKVFECMTGLRLPKSNKETKEFLENLSVTDYGEMKEYKPRKKPQPKDTEVFYIAKISENTKSKFVAVYGEPINKYSLNLFMHKSADGYSYNISSVECGYKICSGANKTKALENLKNVVDNRGVDAIKEQIYQICETHGYSPYIIKQ